MADSSDESPDLPVGVLREVTLRIPGEHFFCETIPLPAQAKEEEVWRGRHILEQLKLADKLLGAAIDELRRP